MSEHKNCMLGKHSHCNFYCSSCGWDRDEDARRKKLPLVADKETGLRRKEVGETETEEGDDL